MILSVTLNPSVDVTLYTEALKPYDTNRVLRVETDAGGKGVNLSRVVATLGGETTATGFLGGMTGAYVRAVLAAQGVANDFLPVSEETRTNTSVEDGTGNPPTTFNARGHHVSDKEWIALLTKIDALSKNARWVALGGSLPPGVPVDAYRTLARLAKDNGAKVALDADGEAARLGLDARPDFFKPNGKEAGRLLGRKVETIEEALFASEELLQYLSPSGTCVVSLGAQGAVMASSAGTFIGRAIPVQSKSTIGSGDSMVAAILLMLSRGEGLEQALKSGLAAGAATARTSGSAIADRAGIEALLPLAQIERAH